MRTSGIFVPLVGAAILFSSCAAPVYYVVPREWTPAAKRDSIIQAYRPALQGRTIFLDPGHGGEDRANRGPTGDAIEADVNLRVGAALRDFLTAAGARVILSRAADTSIALNDRWPMAVRSGAEIFVSLHHNATGTSDDVMNYSSVYYHARPGHPDYHPANQDLARHIERDMSYAMRNPPPPYSPTFDGTLSDFDIYQNSGFAVLRGNPLPAALIEGSFFTHPHEEQRLALAEFNRIEAWGIFLGLGKYFRTGFPALAMATDTIVTAPQFTLRIAATPWEEIDRGSLLLGFAGREAAGVFSDSTRTIDLAIAPPMRSGTYDLSASVRSRAGKASWPFRKRVTVMLPAAAIAATAHPNAISPMPGAVARVSFAVRDSNGDRAADGMPVRLRSPLAGVDTVVRIAGGAGSLYLTPPPGNRELPVELECGSQRTAVQITVAQNELPYAHGVIRSADEVLPIAGARVSILPPSGLSPVGTVDSSDANGRFVVAGDSGSARFLSISRNGYFPLSAPLPESNGTPLEIALNPVASGRLHGKTFVVDARYGGTESGDVDANGIRAADVNLRIARRLFTMLSLAGADAYLMRDGDTTLAESERTKRSAGYPRGFYIRIDAGNPVPLAGAEIYRNVSNRRLGHRILESLNAFAALDTTPVTPSREPFYNDVAMGTVSVRLPSVTTGYYAGDENAAADRCAWGIFGGILRDAGFDFRGRTDFVELEELK